jgi:hypothetical protein
MRHTTVIGEAKAIEVAKSKIQGTSVDMHRREWFTSHPPDSYSSPDQHVILMVLEGSPPRGFILVNRGIRRVCCYHSSMRLVAIIDWHTCEGVED